MTSNIIYKGNNAYKVIREFPTSSFQDNKGNPLPQLLGAWVHYLGGDHVLQANNKMYICETIEDAIILEENAQ